MTQFAFRYVVVTIALWLPSVIRSSAREFICFLRYLSILNAVFRLRLLAAERMVSCCSEPSYDYTEQMNRALIMAQTTLNIYASDQIFK